ncbi:hypothetical protein GN244_ATG18870 [Phytophthora infestans]|uniref:Uncharacterized protein n=1 Tax=Phytophthora infestans TaxID=4787 RepID=A0A833SMY7_PHYIN|nr:hypothetical protein GN244_ATG18870 [Phytophthora infestans]
MTSEEALEVAIATRQVEQVEELLSRFDCTLIDAVVQAASIGLQEIVELLLNKVFGIYEEATEVEVLANDETRKLVDKAVVAQLNIYIVKLLLPQVIGLPHREYSSSWFNVVQNVLDAGRRIGTWVL